MRRLALCAALVVGLAPVAPRGQSAEPTVPDLLERVSTYLVDFEKEYSRVIADERYRQTIKDKRVSTLSDRTPIQTREIRSDILAAPDLGNRWLSFRDVYSVDGRPVRDRDTRLQKLFEQVGANRFEEARRIADEGARFNLGTLSRNINLPSMPLTFITRENRGRSAFRAAGHDIVAGVPVAILDYRETARPTLVKSGPRDLAAQGSFWIEPTTGRVMKASAKFEARDFTCEMLVTFGLVEKLKLWVPLEMKDTAANAKETIEGLAVYTNYRRFDTSVVIK
ncbi:MAG: hypothetical protein EPO35_01770 [Acidobacteria bacterium]|nr:MAG: hypothetical protein EPO35_01770 [Acidobacteriota bacterium]